MSETPDSRKEPKEVSSPPLVSPSQVTVAGDSSQTINISGPSPETVSIGKSAAQTASASPAGAPPLPPSALGDSGATLALPPSAAFDSGATLPLHGNGDSGATLPLPPSAAFDSGATLPLHGNGDSGATLPLPSAGMASNATLESPSVGPTIDPVTGREIPYVSGYDILGELGRGGMGVVYKARQRKLNRLVALKMVLAGGHAGPEQLARFQIEAQAVAALQHPNIVQIYEVGESDSLPHFSLEYVDGAPLDKALAGKPQVPKDAARLLETLSHAMHFAHQHGIVHRDLKPANILVSSEGVPKITDFGLAKQLEGDSSQTKEGALMGTPSYMAPEQARGEFKDLGPAADVYSLGAMLYEMLVGRPPFLGATPFETIFQVIKEEPVPPSRLIPKLPQDIETICLKCLQKEPSKRYATAELLAEDCRRFVSGEPILSRPISPVERLWRWCRRNPRVAGLIATVASLLVVVAIGSTVSALTIAQERNQKEEQRQQAVDARIEAEAASRIAEEQTVIAVAAKKEADDNATVATAQSSLALDTMNILVDKVQKQLEDAPRTQKLKRELLETAMEGLKAVSKAGEGSKSIEATILIAHMKMGNMFRQLGATEEAMKEFAAANAIARRRATDNPDSDFSQLNLASVLMNQGDMTQEHRRDMDAALELYRESLTIWQSLLTNPQSPEGPRRPDPDTIKQQLSEANTRVAITLLRQGDPAGSMPFLQKAIEIRRELVEVYPEEESLRMDLARSYNAVGEVSFLLGDIGQARIYYDDCLALRESMVKASPDNLRLQNELAEACANYGDLCLRNGDNDAAASHFGRCLELFQKLQHDDDQNVDYQFSVASAFYRFGSLAERRGDTATATDNFTRCLELREKMATADPSNDARQMELMLALAHCGNHTRAAEIAETIRAGKSDPELLFEVARCYAQCAAAVRVADAPKADTYAAQAIQALGEAIDDGYGDKVAFRTDPDLDPIRGLAGYEALAPRLEKP